MVEESRFLHDGAFAVNLGVESDLIVKNHDELAFEPIPHLTLVLAVGVARTHLESEGDLLCLLRAVVAPNHHVLLFYAFEFLPVSYELFETRLEDRVSASIRPLNQA